MGVSSIQNRVTLAGDGSSVSFGFPYYFFKQADLIVYIYDTLLGGTTGPMVLTVDYTISGSQNYQGLYQSGGNVIFSTYVPKTTDIVVIIRSPIEQQNYALLQGGTISSAAIVQQFDYLTLLIQRLNDQVARCIQVPDGVGVPFAGQLPSTIAFSAGASPVVNSTENGWTLSPAQWQSATIGYAAVQTGAASNHIPLFALPAGALLRGLAIKHSVPFVGAGLTGVFASLGVAGIYSEFLPFFDIQQAVADQTFDNLGLEFIGSWAGTTEVYLTITSIGGLLSALTAGSVTVYYSYEIVA